VNSPASGTLPQVVLPLTKPRWMIEPNFKSQQLSCEAVMSMARLAQTFTVYRISRICCAEEGESKVLVQPIHDAASCVLLPRVPRGKPESTRTQMLCNNYVFLLCLVESRRPGLRMDGRVPYVDISTVSRVPGRLICCTSSVIFILEHRALPWIFGRSWLCPNLLVTVPPRDAIVDSGSSRGVTPGAAGEDLVEVDGGMSVSQGAACRYYQPGDCPGGRRCCFLVTATATRPFL
jgi:hypothetical protein